MNRHTQKGLTCVIEREGERVKEEKVDEKVDEKEVINTGGEEVNSSILGVA